MSGTSSRQSGFTLIEMLVALSVFSIAALALLRLDGFAVATTADLSSRSLADLVASNEAAFLASEPAAVVLGRSRKAVTNAGRRFDVDTNIFATADPRLVRVEIMVAEQGSTGRSTLTTVKRVQ